MFFTKQDLWLKNNYLSVVLIHHTNTIDFVIDLIKSIIETLTFNKKPASSEPFVIRKVSEQVIKNFINKIINEKYSKIKETSGKNSSPEIDIILKTNGGRPGDPYCLFGIQDILRSVEKEFGIKFDLPKTGSTQGFFNLTKPKYIRPRPSPFSICIYRKIDEYKGHAALCLSEYLGDNESFATFEFNTSPDASNEVVRDGEGCYFKTRSIFGTRTMQIRGFVDILAAVK